MTIILDAMGSDQYPDPEIEGSLRAAEETGEDIILVGRSDVLEPKLKALNTRGLPVTIHHAPDVLEMADKVVDASRQKPQNSMAVGLELLKQGHGQAFVTAGNTGGAMFNAIRKLGRMKGIDRTPLATFIPTKSGRCIALDIGANADCRPDFLLQFAILGSVYAEKFLNIPKPRVGILSNGEEAGKGNQLIKDTYPLLAHSGLNFIGNVEPKEVFYDGTDVVVMDGFTGNVLIKSSEAVAKMLIDVLKEELMSSLVTKVGAALAKPAFTRLKKMLDPSEIGAGALLGVDGLVFIGHGRSDARAIASAIRGAHQAVQSNLLEALRSAIQ